MQYRFLYGEEYNLIIRGIICVKYIYTWNNMCYNLVKWREKMKSYSSREVVKLLIADGWYEVHCVGDHHQFKHPTKKGRVTVTHPKKDVTKLTLKGIEQQSGLKFE